VIEKDTVRERMRAQRIALEKVAAAMTALLASQSIPQEHTARQALVESLGTLRVEIDATASILCNVVFVEQKFAPLPVTCYFPDIIDIESEEDEDHRPSE
jgi:hypothetical protein